MSNKSRYHYSSLKEDTKKYFIYVKLENNKTYKYVCGFNEIQFLKQSNFIINLNDFNWDKLNNNFCVSNSNSLPDCCEVGGFIIVDYKTKQILTTELIYYNSYSFTIDFTGEAKSKRKIYKEKYSQYIDFFKKDKVISITCRKPRSTTELTIEQKKYIIDSFKDKNIDIINIDIGLLNDKHPSLNFY